MPKYHSPKIPLPVKDSGPHINMVLWAPRVHIPHGISVDSATFVDRQTHTKVDHATCARNSGPHLLLYNALRLRPLMAEIRLIRGERADVYLKNALSVFLNELKALAKTHQLVPCSRITHHVTMHSKTSGSACALHCTPPRLVVVQLTE